MFGVRLDDIKVNGKSLNICQTRPQGCMITFDSGTSLMSVPTFAFNSMAKQKVPTAHTFVECENKDVLEKWLEKDIYNKVKLFENSEISEYKIVINNF